MNQPGGLAMWSALGILPPLVRDGVGLAIGLLVASVPSPNSLGFGGASPPLSTRSRLNGEVIEVAGIGSHHSLTRPSWTEECGDCWSVGGVVRLFDFGF